MSDNKTKYDITGMSCAACSARVQRAVSKVEGVETCAVNLLTNSMIVSGDVSSDLVIAAVEQAGYGASVHGQNVATAKTDNSQDNQTKKIVTRLVSSIIFLVILMYFSMGHSMFGLPVPLVLDNYISLGILQMLLAGIVMVINQKFFISGFKSSIHGSPNMDALVSLGSGAAFLYSVVALINAINTSTKPSLYFESSAMIVTLITIGKMLESYSKGKTTNALQALIKLAPQTAIVIRDGQEITVPIENVVVGDIFIVKSGQAVAVDGVVLEGNSAINESSLTGESIPVNKSVGHKVFAGTLNTNGHLRCRATKVGNDTALSQIIKMVSDASATKAPIAKIADKVSGVFVPTVIVIAVITMLIWLAVGKDFGFAIARGICVLVISCPCALGLATPVAIMVGTGVGAKHGILYKNATSLERAGKVNAIVFDKTGTITKGEPQVVEVFGEDKQNVVQLALNVETKSTHPLAVAICQYGQTLGLSPQPTSDFSDTAGLGLSATFENKRLVVGNSQFALANALPSQTFQVALDNYQSKGYTCVVVCVDNIQQGIIAISDVVKPDSQASIEQLKSMNVNVCMASGDNVASANAIGKQVGIDDVRANVLPADKMDIIKSLQQKHIVAMVGDGINDSPALTAADIGIAIGAGTDVAIDSADIVLVKNSLSDVVTAIRLSKRVIGNIYVNLFWAFFYNILGIPLAAGAFIKLFGWQLTPAFGALAMSLSSFCVVMNALTINLFKVKKSKNEITNQSDKNQIKKETKLMQKTMKITGMMCGHCEATVKKTLEIIDGVTEATVSHTAGTAIVNLSKDVDNDILKKAVEAQDYSVTSIE